MISPATIENIKDVTRIEDVVAAFVTLKKRGSNLQALCPFHDEKTPSFNVNPARGIFKCFGCGKGGDAIAFLREKGLDYVSALKWLADHYKIEIKETDDGKDTKQHDRRVQLRTTASVLQAHFAMSKGEKETPGRQYWMDRGFTADTLDTFGIGWCDGSKPDHVPNSDLADIGAINDKGNLIFYKRSTIPIHDQRGNLVAWAGRTIDNREEKDRAKYINSPNTDIYSKNTTLYNLHRAAPAIRTEREIWIVEGYADAMAAWQFGIYNVVALCGTSLTDAHVLQLKKFNGEVPLRIILALDNEITKEPDGSSNGDAKTFKVQVAVAYYAAIEKLVPLGEVLRLKYPRGKGRALKDIGEMIQRNIDPAECEKVDVIEDYVQRKLSEDDWAKKASAVERADFQEHVARLLSRIKRESVRDIYIKTLCGLMELQPKKFSDMVAKYDDQAEKTAAYDILDYEYIIIKDEFRQRIPEKDDNTGEINWKYQTIKKSTITDQFGNAFIRTIPRFAKAVIKPSHVKYQRTIQIVTDIGTYNFFNDYEPLKFKPKPFDLPQKFISEPYNFDYREIPEIKNVAALMHHIFEQGKNALGNDYLQIAWDWLAIMYLQPEQRLPAVGIVSKEEGTGKSTLINVLAKFFGANATKIDASRIAAKFNALMGGKVLAYCEETKDDRGQMENVLKDLITGFEMVLEKKFGDAEVVPTFCKFLLASNHPETFMKVGTATTRFFISHINPIPENQKVKNMEQLCYMELPYLAYFLEKRGIMIPSEDRLWFKPERYENEALKRLRQASKDVVEQNMELLIQDVFLKCNITSPVLIFTSSQLQKMMVAYAGKLYESKTPNYFGNVATRDLNMVYNDVPTKKESIAIKGMDHPGWVNFEMWEIEKKKLPGRFIEFPIWKFCKPEDIYENYSLDSLNDLIINLANDAAKLSETYGTDPAEWLQSLTSLTTPKPALKKMVGEDIPF